MKIVIVLCSLATFAIAVPVYQENVFESSLSNQPLSIKREKKSALDFIPGLSPDYGIEKIQTHSSKKSVQGTSVEAKSFRRPIIIKRKLGYHVYRDSDEEMAYAEPGEKCREQVKFKLCDHEPASSSKNRIKSPTFKCMESYKTDNEMENSIKMAKQAVEYLQKDLKRMENFSPKMANPHIEDIESKSGLHHDIEIAREALENIEQNFESVNLKVNKVNELQIPKSQDVERLTRWREAIENIHKNFEIVKNIEDAFQTDNHFSLFRSNNKKADESEEPMNTQSHLHVQNKFTNDNLEINGEAYNEDQILKSASNHDGIAQLTPQTENIDNIGKDVGYDMFISPTENRERKVQLHSDSLKSEIHYKDASLRNDRSEIESTKQDSNLPKESIEYSPKNSNYLSEVPTNKEHEKTTNDYINKDYKFDIERQPEVSTLQYSKSVSELPNDQMLLVTTKEKVDITDNQHAHKEEAGMKSSGSQNEKLQLNNMHGESGHASTRLDIESNSDDTIAQYFKSVPENQLYPVDSLPLDKEENANDQQSHREEANMRSSVSQNIKMQSSENQEEHANLPMGLGIERLSEDRIWKDAKSVPELPYDPMLLVIISEKGDNADDQHAHKEEAGMRSSDSQNEKLQLNEYQEQAKHASTRLEVENSSNDIKAQYFKSVSELQPYAVEPLPLDKAEITYDHRAEVSMRSSESQNEKMQSSENQEQPEFLPMGLHNEHHLEERKIQYSKSVPELSFDTMLSVTTSEKVDNIDDQHAHKEEPSMRSSESQNEKLQLNEYREQPKQASTGFDIEKNSDDTTSQYFKSVPELQPYPVESLPLDKGDATNDQQSYTEEASVRLSESQNEKIQSIKNQEEHQLLPMGFDIERHSEEPTSQYSKSVPEMPYDITYDQHAQREEGMRSSESQNEKMQSSKNQEEHKILLKGLGIERLPEERKWQDAKSVPELPNEPMLSITSTDKMYITDDQHAYEEEAGMRSSESQNKKLQINEYREEPKQASTRLDIARNSDDATAKYFKSVSELQPYPVESLPLDKEEMTNDQQSYTEEASMRSSESQNDKMQSSENQEKHELLPMGVGIERLPEEHIRQDAKSVPELAYDPMLSVTTSEKVDNTDDQHAHKEEASMRSSESQNEKMQSKENQEEHETLSLGLDIERLPEERNLEEAKSVPELPYDPMLSVTTPEKVDNTDDQHAHKEETSMRSSESQNEKMQSIENQEEPKQASTRLDIENSFDDITAPYFKSVPELQPYPVESLPLDYGDTTNDQQSYRAEASMRSSESTNEKMQSSENQEEHELLPIGLGIDHLPEERVWQDAKSVPELPYDPMLSVTTSEKVGNTDDQHAHKKEASMRLSENQNEKMPSSENQEEHETLSLGLDIERLPEERILEEAKSVPELPYDPMLSVTTSEKVDNTDDQHAHREETSMKSSESQNEKMQSIENQEEPKQASTRLDIENSFDDITAQYFKSVPELQTYPVESLPLDYGDTTNDQQSYRAEASMRSSESINEKMQSSENQEEHELLPIGLGIEHLPEERVWQDAKSVPELPYDPMLSVTTSEKVDNTDDQHAHKKEASMRSLENQNEKMPSSENQEEHELLPMGLDIDRLPEGRFWQDAKSVPELAYDPMLSVTTSEKVDNTDDQHTHKEEASMRSAGSQNEKLQLRENQEEHELLPMGIDIERLSKERIWQDAKSVPELPYDHMLSVTTSEKVDNNDDQHAHKEEAGKRLSESQNVKLQLNEYREEPKQASTRLDIENSFDDITAQYFKSVPELQPYPVESLPLDYGDTTNDQQSYREEVSMRSSESTNEKMKSSENQEEHELLPIGLGIDHFPEERVWQDAKSVPELLNDPMLSLTTSGKVDNTDDQHAHKEEASMRSSESQNQKLQLNEFREEPKQASTRLDIENSSDDITAPYFKSVPELHSYPVGSLPLDYGDTTNDQQSYKEEPSMRSSESSNEKIQSNENREVHEILPMGLNFESHPEERKWLFSKSVPEFSYDTMVSMPSDNIEITNRQHFLKEGNMRLSQNQYERAPFDEHHELSEFLPTNLDDARLSQTQRERQHMYFNHYLYEPHSSRFDIKSKLEDDSLPANKLRFNFIQNPTKDQTVMRLSQNQNVNKEVQYPSTSLGLSNDMSGVDNAAHIMNDFMLSAAQPQQLHENRDPMLRSSNERHHLSHNLKSLPEYKMLPQTSQFEFSNGHNVLNEHINMRINQEKSRDPEPMENPYKHNSLAMRWNTENQQDPSPNPFKSYLDFDHTPYKGNELGNEQFIPASKTANTLEYRSRPQFYGDHILEDTPSSRWYQTVQHNDRFANYYKTIPEVQEENTNPHFRNHLHRVAVNHRVNNADTFTSHDFPSSRARLYDHMQKYHQEKPSNIDSSMEPSMPMSTRDQFAKSGTEFNNMYFNHPHGTARFVKGLPIAGVSPGAMGVFPTGNAGGCGIPLLLSCSPSVVSGSLARPNIVGPLLKSVDENIKYYIKRDAKNIADEQDIKVKKLSLPPSHGAEAASEI